MFLAFVASSIYPGLLPILCPCADHLCALSSFEMLLGGSWNDYLLSRESTYFLKISRVLPCVLSFPHVCFSFPLFRLYSLHNLFKILFFALCSLIFLTNFRTHPTSLESLCIYCLLLGWEKDSVFITGFMAVTSKTDQHFQVHNLMLILYKFYETGHLKK